MSFLTLFELTFEEVMLMAGVCLTLFPDIVKQKSCAAQTFIVLLGVNIILIRVVFL